MGVPRRTQEEEELRTTHRIFLGFDLSRIRQVEDSNVHCVITSPSYWYTADHGNLRKIGYKDKLITHFRKLGKAWSKFVRGLHLNCRLTMNIADEYLRASKKVQHQIVPPHAHLVNNITNLLSRKLTLVPPLVLLVDIFCQTTLSKNPMGSHEHRGHDYVSYHYKYSAIFKTPWLLTRNWNPSSKVPRHV